MDFVNNIGNKTYYTMNGDGYVNQSHERWVLKHENWLFDLTHKRNGKRRTKAEQAVWVKNHPEPVR